MKKLYVRFFEKDKGIPTDSRPITYWDTNGEVINAIEDWLNRHPDGRVDFILLP